MTLGVTNEKRKPARLLLEELFARAEIKFRKETTTVLLRWLTSTVRMRGTTDKVAGLKTFNSGSIPLGLKYQSSGLGKRFKVWYNKCVGRGVKHGNQDF